MGPDASVCRCWGLMLRWLTSTASTTPYKRLVGRIAPTDALIDQVVYRLYGLTEEEIAVVEGGDKARWNRELFERQSQYYLTIVEHN